MWSTFVSRRARSERAAARRGLGVRGTFVLLLGLIVGYALFAVAGFWAIELYSGSGADHALEARMISVFAIGPAGAVAGAILGLFAGAMLGRRGRRLAPSMASEQAEQ
jgi:hypothetical protein